jgi:NADH:ubiquinone oxidoreductase subunit D
MDERGGIGLDLRSFNINFGPQHPASHGVLRIILQMRGELIERADTHIGLLHRGTEKLIEERAYVLGLPYFDRLDYTSILIQEHAYCLAIEDLLGSANYLAVFAQVRMLFDELTRILNHLILMSTHSMDVGTMAIFFWAFEERERIMEFYERVSGARMHAAFYRPNEMSINYITSGLLKDIVFFCRDLFKRIGQIESRLNSTTIWRARLAGVGVVSPSFVYDWGVTGPLARSAGVRRDLRLNHTETYGGYFYLNVRSFVGENGDCYDRFLIRMREMAESIHIVLQIASNWVEEDCQDWGAVLEVLRGRSARSFRRSHPSSWCSGMEELIEHFKYFSEGASVPAGAVYRAVESAKGEFGVLMVSDGSSRPYRCRIRSPAYFHTQLFAPMVQGHFFADMLTIVGSQDIVMGEVDR